MVSKRFQSSPRPKAPEGLRLLLHTCSFRAARRTLAEAQHDALKNSRDPFVPLASWRDCALEHMSGGFFTDFWKMKLDGVHGAGRLRMHSATYKLHGTPPFLERGTTMYTQFWLLPSEFARSSLETIFVLAAI